MYILKDILHDWNDEDSLTILKQLSDSMKPNSKLIIIEMVMELNENYVTEDHKAFSDLLMHVTPGGK